MGIVLVCALGAVVPARGAAGDYEGQRITAIRFEPPQQPLVSEDLKEKIAPLSEGEPLRLADVRAAIEKLFQSGRYDDIAVDARPENGGVALTFVTEDQLFVRGVTVEGVPEPPNQGQLVNAAKLQLGEPFSDAQLKQSSENVLETLRLNGFYLAKVDTDKFVEPATQQIDVRLIVDAGERAHFGAPVIKGNLGQKIDAGKIVGATKWKRFLGLGGFREVTEVRVQQGLDKIRRLYQKHDYLMARIGLDQMDFLRAENRLVPHITVESGPKVRVELKGAKISRGRLRQLLPLYQEQTVDKDLLIEGRRNITEYLQGQGYFEAAVDFDLHDAGADEQVVEYVIDRGERHKLAELIITGNQYFEEETIRERMYLTPATLVRFRHGRYSSDFLRRDVNAIEDLYRANGFRDVHVTSRVEDDYQGKENELAVFVRIEEGPQWFVHRLEIVGAGQENLSFIEGVLQSSQGQPFSDFNIVTDQENILSYYYNNGYPDASFEAAVNPAGQPHRMDLKYTIREGERRFVRGVMISGLHTTDADLVSARLRNLEPGDPLSQSAMTDSQRRLYDLGIFARVDTAIQNPEGETDHKFVLYRFEEARKWSLTGGVGAQIARIGGGSTLNLDAPAGSAGFSPRVSFGVSRSNFMGLGHTISLQTRVSNLQRRGLITYLAPQFKGNEDLNLTFTGLYDDSRDIRTFSAKRMEGSVQLGQRLSKANSAQYRVAYRRVSVDKNSIKITPQLIPRLSQGVRLGIISGTFIQDRRDDPTDARRGIYNTIDSALASNFFGSKTTFTRIVARNATFHRLGRDFIFARSLSFGWISKLSQLEVPLPELLFAGGASSHRGFPENQAGPRDLVTGFPVGGKALLFNTLELRYPLLGDNIHAVLFHDAGNVYSSLKSISLKPRQGPITNFDYMVHAAGFGIRYRTPVGPIRVDLAYAINPPRFEGFKGTLEELLVCAAPGRPVTCTKDRQQLSHFQFHFSLGQTF